MDPHIVDMAPHNNRHASCLVDVSDNADRVRLIQRLKEAASSPLNAVPPHHWSAPIGKGVADALVQGESSHADIANVWEQLNSLRVMAQYSRTLGVMCDHHPYLHAHHSTCIIGLEWMSRFVRPLQAPNPDALESIERSIKSFSESQMGTPMSKERATFEFHKRLVCSDRDLTSLLLLQHFPNMSCREYDVDVCAFMLSRCNSMHYDQWLSAFPCWRDSGLFFPMALSAVYMPQLGSWLPEEKQDTTFAITLQNCLNSLGRPSLDHVAPLKTLAAVWAADTTGSAQIVAVTLDRIAVLMGIKSNGSRPGEFDLSTALAAFPRSFGDPDAGMHESNYHAWHSLRSVVEATFPPSLLLAPCVRPKRPTWGYNQLTLEIANVDGFLPSARFAEGVLQLVQPESADNPLIVRVDRSAISAFSPVFNRDCLLNQTSFRIQDVLWRLGEIVTSPDVAACMLYPMAAMANLVGAPAVYSHPTLAMLVDRNTLLNRMAGLSSSLKTVDAHYQAFTKALEATVPPVFVTHFPETQSILMWRLDIPSRAIIYMGTGAEVSPAAESQHHLHKVLVNSKVQQRPVGGIVQIQPRSDESALRECLCHFAATDLAGHPSNTVLVKAGDAHSSDDDDIGSRQTMPISCTTLAESVACFALCPPSKLNRTPLGGSCAWKENGIDPRYAERQQAENGARYRDWVAMHAGRGGTQQSRLASHFVEYDSIYTTKMPWIQEDKSVNWVNVSSTAPPESKTLQGKTLRQAVESRFLHDLRMLPSHTQLSRPKIERSNAEIYTANGGTKVAIAYAPSGQDKLDFIAFECA
jgi:hypothetical protein